MKILFWRINDDRIAEVALTIAKRALAIARQKLAKQCSASAGEIDQLNASLVRSEERAQELEARFKKVNSAAKDL